ncbi:nitroreductase family protein [Chloroflexota bacterium]
MEAMEAMEAILSRRSIRKYTLEAVSQKLIDKLLAAAMSAPSAGNEQPWQFLVINDRSILAEVPNYHPFSKMVPEASVAILVCGDLSLEKTKLGSWAQDCLAAVENILIAARAYGLGVVWLGVYPIKERMDGMRKLCGLPQNVMPLALVPVGYPAEEKPPANRYDPSRIHYNLWSA